MDFLHFSENLIRLRHEKNLTQKQLADFLGVTKASVSKWETKQSLPDLLILPKLSSFFDVSIDELLGYQPQLSKEEIRKIYHNLADSFASEPFEAVMKKSKQLVKKYYSCYRFLLQTAVLWLNHFMIPKQAERQKEILSDAEQLCIRIQTNCCEISLQNDARCVLASINLVQQAPEKAIGIMESLIDPCSFLSQADSLMIKAYLSAGRTNQADSFLQISTYIHLISLIDHAGSWLTIRQSQFDLCEETIQRTIQLIQTFKVDTLHPGSVVMFELQAAIFYASHNKKERALDMLLQYAQHIKYLLQSEHIKLPLHLPPTLQYCLSLP